MAHVKVVCDASYKEDLRFTGYAGGIFADEDNRATATYMYQGVVGELHNIQEGELIAILVGLRELQKRMTYSGLQVDSISIYSDSKSSVLNLINEPDPTRLDKYSAALVDRINVLCKSNDWKPQFSHVNAHVSSMHATGIERLNAIADKRAASVRREGLNQMLAPDTQDSPYITLLLPKRARNTQEAIEWKRLACALLEEDKKIRVFIENNATEHPFIEGVEAFCAARQVIQGKVMRRYDYNAQASHSGLDMTLLRHHTIEQGRDPHFEIAHTPNEVRASIASRLLFGEAAPELSNMDMVTGRLYPPSSAVFDLMDPLPKNIQYRPNSVQGWLHTYLDYVKVPLHRGLIATLNSLNLLPLQEFHPREEREIPAVDQSTSALTDDGLKTEIRTVYEENVGEDKDLAVKAVVDTLLKNGYPDNELFRSGMSRFISLTPSGDCDAFFNRILRQANKLTPPGWCAKQDVSENPRKEDVVPMHAVYKPRR